MERAVAGAKAEFNAASQKAAGMRDEFHQVEAELRSAELAIAANTKRLENVSTTAGVRIKALNGMSGFATTAREFLAWVAEKKRTVPGFFKGEVYGPVAAHIELTDPKDAGLAAMVETAIPAYIRFGFIFTNTEDFNKPELKKWRGSGNKQLSFLFESRTDKADEEIARSRSQRPDDKVNIEDVSARLGPCGWLDEYIRGPKEVLAAIYANVRPQYMLACRSNDAAERYFAERMQFPRGMTMFTPSASVRVFANDYDGTVSTTRSAVRAAEMLQIYAQSNSVGEAQIRDLIANAQAGAAACRARHGAMVQQRSVYTAEADALSDKYKRLEGIRRRRQELVAGQATAQKEADRAQQALADDANREEQLRETLCDMRRLQVQQLEMLGKTPQRLAAVRAAMQDEWVACLAKYHGEQRVRALGEEIRDAAAKRKTAADEAKRWDDAVRKTTAELEAARKQFMANVKTISASPKLKARMAYFEGLPKVTEDIEASIKELKVGLNGRGQKPSWQVPPYLAHHLNGRVPCARVASLTITIPRRRPFNRHSFPPCSTRSSRRWWRTTR